MSDQSRGFVPLDEETRKMFNEVSERRAEEIRTSGSWGDLSDTAGPPTDQCGELRSQLAAVTK